jgi:hypothetical protein
MSITRFKAIFALSEGEREEYFSKLGHLHKERQKAGRDGVVMSPRMAYEIFTLLILKVGCFDDFLMFYNSQAVGSRETKIIMGSGVKFIREEEGWRVMCYPEEEKQMGERIRSVNPILAKMFQAAKQR